MPTFVISESDASIHDKDGTGITSEADSSDSTIQRLHVSSDTPDESVRIIREMADTLSSISSDLSDIKTLLMEIVSED